METGTVPAKSSGRPPRHVGQKLSKNRTFRIRRDLDAALMKAAEQSGRSVSETIERWLETHSEFYRITDDRSPGRPRRYSGQRPTWTVRLAPDIGADVVAAARAAGRSISEEIERRIMRERDLTEAIRAANARAAAGHPLSVET